MVSHRLPHRAGYREPPLRWITDTHAPWHVYVLHLSWPNGPPSHYVGITATDRISDRLRQHATGWGAKATRLCVNRSGHMHLVALYPTHSRSDERHIEATYDSVRLCGVCQPSLPTLCNSGILPAQITTQEPRRWRRSRPSLSRQARYPCG
jgi:predicted GIY-YIG superfamily endonuclease